jgi:hypothetical protein
MQCHGRETNGYVFGLGSAGGLGGRTGLTTQVIDLLCLPAPLQLSTLKRLLTKLHFSNPPFKTPPTWNYEFWNKRGISVKKPKYHLWPWIHLVAFFGSTADIRYVETCKSIKFIWLPFESVLRVWLSTVCLCSVLLRSPRVQFHKAKFVFLCYRRFTYASACFTLRSLKVE